MKELIKKGKRNESKLMKEVKKGRTYKKKEGQKES